MANSVIRAGRAVGALAKPDLDKDRLMERAASEAGLDDFGDPWFEQPLDVLLQSLREEARLNPAGDFSAMQQFHKVLTDRLWARMWFKRHPEILERAIPRPVVIVGPMRSGTTRLHRLLASDRRFSHMRSFETISPVPRPDFEDVLAGEAEDFRPVLAGRIMKVARLANPRTLSIHPTGPYQPEEELGLFVSSMWGMKHDAQWQIPSYTAWCETQDAEPAYRQLADLLRLVGWSQQVSSIRPWILKTPQHMLDLPALLKVFPDARLIFTHRDPQAVVGSAASLAWNQTILYSDHVDPADIGREWLRKTELMIARMRAARDSIPRERMIDVQYDDMDRDWRATMERIYAFLGLDIAPALPGMESYLEAAESLKRNPHRYSLEQFGLSTGEVAERLGDYTRTYAIPTEAEAGRGRAERRSAAR
ncbi:sulfotransferase family protein [Altererythrobacter lutimaris]|uniref:Sulfotransferase n=1 Tax=Altererythrobacter lutimaris TaxID=2743979 RepID=A0A850HA53_9SPHN|nr:sulfotransferase [Altererythrobacter lutimaris]NVE94833.1 sulfotransferase [Altererythrobacter lutimaris]